MNINVEFDEADLRRCALEVLQKQLGEADKDLTLNDVKFEVKSKTNFRPHEWEAGKFRVIIIRTILLP